VVPELGGTITVVALCDGGGLLAQPQSTAPRISKLDTTFIFISLFDRQWPFREPIADPKSVSPIWTYPASRPEASPRVGWLAYPALGQFCNLPSAGFAEIPASNPKFGLRVAAYGQRIAELLASM
jgi:hypothetical protein